MEKQFDRLKSFCQHRVRWSPKIIIMNKSFDFTVASWLLKNEDSYFIFFIFFLMEKNEDMLRNKFVLELIIGFETIRLFD